MTSRDLAAEVRGIVVANARNYQVKSIILLGEGVNHIAYEVNGELIVRFAKEPALALRAARVHQEARLLAAVREISPLPVPILKFIAADQGCLAYAKLPGIPLLDVPHSQRMAHSVSIAATLGGLLARLHATPVDRLASGAVEDDQPLILWRDEAAQTYATIVEHIPAVRHEPIEAFLEAVPPEDKYTLAFSHNDLGIEHVLVQPKGLTVTGIIDWSDAAVVDPARDFGLLYRDLGPIALDCAIGRYGGDAVSLTSLRARAEFYARCSVLEDWAFGIESGKANYVEKCVAAMEWLFGA